MPNRYDWRDPSRIGRMRAMRKGQTYIAPLPPLWADGWVVVPLVGLLCLLGAAWIYWTS